MREGGDRGLPAALAGEATARGREFAAIAHKIAERAQQISAASEDILEIT